MRLGVDWGGTKIEVIALSDEGDMLLRERVFTPRDDYTGCLQALHGLVKLAEERTGQRGTLGIGIPGTLSPSSGRVKNANSTWMNGKLLLQDLQKLLDRDVRIENDANCFAVSEAVDGAGKGEPMVAGIILGTGHGSGIAYKGKALSGKNGICGEMGHNPLPWMNDTEYPGLACWCGRTGCSERYISGTGFCDDYKRATGNTLKGYEIMALVGEGNEAAQTCYTRYADRLARVLSTLVNQLDPHVIVLGGGMSNVDALYHDLPSLMLPYIFSDTFETPIRKAVHGDSSGVRGAAWLW